MGKYLKKLTTSIYYSKIFKHSKNDINTLYNLLADQKSKDTLKGILKAYTTICKKPEYYFSRITNTNCNNYHFTTANGFKVCGTENPYFLDDIFSFDKEMVYLDGGAYIGDTIQLLFNKLGGACKQTYAFEPNEDIFKKLLESVKVYGNSVTCFKAGLDDHDGTVSFLKADSGSKISDDGTEIIDVVNIKTFLKQLQNNYPTFIKLDIEGKEKVVINAMADFISSKQPDLAISVYHKLEDLWEIPLQIHRLNPKYKIYLRHQSNYFTETVCYAKKE